MNFGKFINTTPLHCEWLRQESWWGLWKVDIWEYFTNPGYPLTHIQPDGTRTQPDRHFITDFGSIPPPLMSFPSFSRTRFIHAYLMHDSGYKHGWLWTMKPGTVAYVFTLYTKAQMDDLLLMWLGAEGANYVQRHTIYRAVRVASLWIKYPQSPRSKPVT